jgi:hypothetical protein
MALTVQALAHLVVQVSDLEISAAGMSACLA